MSEYEVGKDISDLQHRVTQLERLYGALMQPPETEQSSEPHEDEPKR